MISRRARSTTTTRASEEPSLSGEVTPAKTKDSEEAAQKPPGSSAKNAPSEVELDFEKDERILCYHGPLLYEAKVLKAEFWDAEKLALQKQNSKKSSSKGKSNNPQEDAPGPRYQIHYKGWKQRWDEWVTASRILKWTPSNLELQTKLNKKVTIPKPRKTTTTTTTAPSTSSPKSPTPSKPSPVATKPMRSSTKPETPQVLERSPSVVTPEVTIQTPASRPKRKIPETTGFRSKRLQAIRSQQVAAESPKNSESETPSRTRPTSNKVAENDSESESMSETPSDGEKLSSSNSGTPSVQAPAKAKSTPADSQRNKRKNTREEQVSNANTPKQRVMPIWDGPPRLELPIPDELKIHLIDQWDLISRCQALIPLPRKPSVRQILADYREYAVHALLAESRPTDDTTLTETHQDIREGEVPSCLRFKIDVINEVVDGILLYFAKTLGSFLLYRFERPQHARLLALYPKARLYFQSGDLDNSHEEADCIDPNSSAAKLIKTPAPSEADWDLVDIYGAEHLLRLFAYLPKLLSRSDLDSQGLDRIKVYLEDILAYLASRKQDLFLEQFETAPPSYTKVVKME